MSDELKAERSRQMKDYEEKVINIMDSAKDSIRTQFDKAYKSGYEDAKSELGQDAIDLAHEESDRAYQQGLDDAWEAMRKLALSSSEGGLDLETIAEIFDGLTYYTVLKNVSASEAIAKIKEYEEQQKQDTEIKVGDEVVMDDKGRKAVVSRVLDDAYNIVFYNGDTNCVDSCFVAKTGRHFPQIAEVLAEMRGEE